ncbi:hypothetical protein Y032_0509g2728 [Ancylostoma ceylanicum]|uniref:Secreted protein n=1 Tax=Ancylostoma ceylanicum TaxID=53326 RepID=A0A016WTI2_9BILA|nr:hypothetical protein Y032_0509g2728 [Ancylostoma ceylanicum]
MRSFGAVLLTVLIVAHFGMSGAYGEFLLVGSILECVVRPVCVVTLTPVFNDRLRSVYRRPLACWQIGNSIIDLYL